MLSLTNYFSITSDSNDDGDDGVYANSMRLDNSSTILDSNSIGNNVLDNNRDSNIDRKNNILGQYKSLRHHDGDDDIRNKSK
ncbi:MAG: hypothetical protein BGO43_02230 [Gammaproteobacteria bacterium 39-13]|nr:MAG: hypothetical protein BGO43_02230 [Gammaproteobacteria bacterium 39-13]